MYHKTTIVGNLGQDPELRYTADGTAVCNFTVATNDRRGGREETLWFRVTTWRRLAEVANEYLSKGRMVLVEGTLRADPNTGKPLVFTKRDGTPGASFELNATTLKFLPGSAPANAQSGKPASKQEEDEIPF